MRWTKHVKIFFDTRDKLLDRVTGGTVKPLVTVRDYVLL